MVFQRIAASVFAALLISPIADATAADHDKQRPLSGIRDGEFEKPFTDKFGSFVSDVMGDWKVPGMSIAVVDGDDIYTKGFGFATFPDVKATPETLFLAGSTTKAFVAATLAQMIDSANYSALSNGWSTPISSIIRDDFVLQDAWSTSHITLEDAVSHRTGMPRHDLASVSTGKNGQVWSAGEAVRNLRNLKPSTELRTTWQYCNLMYVTLGHVIETLTGQWLGDTIRDIIWEPLGMNASFGDTKHAQAAPEHLATGYIWDHDRKKYKELPSESMREHGGAGLVISNVVDYAKWVKCLLHKTGPFSESVHQDIRRPRMLAPPQKRTGPGQTNYGLAWHEKVAHGAVVLYHGGAEMAYGAQVYWLHEHKYGVIALANTVPEFSTAAEEVIVWRLIEDKLQVPEQDRFNISGPLKESLEEQKRTLSHPDELLYPERPKPSLPSALNNTQLAGKYVDKGYGTLNIVEEHRHTAMGQVTLVAKRPEMLSPYEMLFRHVSGNFWSVGFFFEPTNSTDVFMAAEFQVGVDGKAKGLKLGLSPPGAAIDEGNVWFRRAE